MAQLQSVDQLRAAARGAGGSLPQSEGVFRVSLGKPKAYDDGSRRVRFCFSDSSVDRAGDVIRAEGWALAGFEKNPVALWAHDSSAPPIGRASAVRVEDTRLMGDIEFASAEVYPFADTIYRLVTAKFVNAVSVGFQPLEYEFAGTDDREWGIDFLRQELLEISVVPVPCNANALIEARAKGIDTRPLVEWAERTLDGGGKVILPRAEVERLRKEAKEPARKRRKADDGGMSESDPAAGGIVVAATCARGPDEECGLINPADCAVHGGKHMADKEVADMIRRAVRAEIKAALKGIAPTKTASRRRKEADGADDPEPDAGDTEHEKSLRMAHKHFKAADDFYEMGDDHHDKGMDALENALETLDNPEGDKAAKSEGDEDDEEDREKAAALLARAKRLRAASGS